MASLANRGWCLFLLAALAFALPGCGESADQPEQEPAAAGPLVRIDLNVEGMTCENCVKTVERVLSRCAGVEEVAVDLEIGQAVVEGRGMDGAELSGAVAEAGYTTTVKPAVPGSPVVPGSDEK